MFATIFYPIIRWLLVFIIFVVGLMGVYLSFGRFRPTISSDSSFIFSTISNCLLNFAKFVINIRLF